MKSTITIFGTHCNACKILIEETVKELPGVKYCSLDFKTGITEIVYNKNMDWVRFKNEIEDLGQYEVIIK